MRNSLIFLPFVCGWMCPSCVLPYGEEITVDATADAQIDAPIDTSADAPTDTEDGATWHPGGGVCEAAGIACVAGWCAVEDPMAPQGCKCIRCDTLDAGVDGI